MSDEMPFSDTTESTSSPQDRAESTPSRQDPAELITRIFDIRGELERGGANKLLAELEELKDELKGLMLRDKLDRVVDEESGEVAEIQVRTRDSWDQLRLERLLTPAQRERYLRAIDVKAIENGCKIGDLSRAKLEVSKAVRRLPYSTALVFRPLTEADVV